MKDNFSTQAKLYAQFRPTYPQTLYNYVLAYTQGRKVAWDCATGNGQVAEVLATHFEQVKATDISQKQLDQAKPSANIEYLISSAEQTPFADDSFDLITVGQALHWFDFERFNAEVKRVAKSGAVLAVWGYELLNISEEIDAAIVHFYKNIVGSYWDDERLHIENHYASVPFPYEDIRFEVFTQTYTWGIEELAGYLSTWSSVQKFIKQNGYNPVNQFIEGILPLWEEKEMTVKFPVFLKMGRVLWSKLPQIK